MRHQNPIFTVTMPVGSYNDVIFDITYSGGETDNDLEFEWAEISPKNNFSAEQVEEITELLECGAYEDIIEQLQYEYADSNINFIVD